MPEMSAVSRTLMQVCGRRATHRVWKCTFALELLYMTGCVSFFSKVNEVYEKA